MRQLEILLSFFLLLHTFVKQTFKLPLLNQSVLGIQMEKRRDILKIHSTLLELLSSHFSQFSYSLPLCTNVFCIRGVTKDFSRFSDSTLNNTRSLRKQAKSRKGDNTKFHRVRFFFFLRLHSSFYDQYENSLYRESM